MSISKRKQLLKLFTILVAVVTSAQGMIAGMPMSPEATKIVSSILLFLASGLTTWRQWLSNDTRNGAMWATGIVAAIATITGLADMVSTTFHMSATTGQWVRFGFTFITMTLSLVSQVLYPSEQKKEKDARVKAAKENEQP